MSETIAFLYAHPDDETFLSGCLIRQLADGGHRPVLMLATKGDAGGRNGEAAHLSREELGALRAAEMERAGEVLGIAAIAHLGYPDGQLDAAHEGEAVDAAIRFLNEHQPSVAVTFPADGGNGHRDHIAISRIATAAVLSGKCPSVRKLYYAEPCGEAEAGSIPANAVTVDTKPGWPVKAEALRAHRSQLLAIGRFFGDLEKFPNHRRYETFTLRWARGEDWPDRRERTLLHGLNEG